MDYLRLNSCANYIVYWRFLVGEAEKFFNDGVNELKQVCISQLMEAFISASISSQFTRKLYVDSEAVSSMQTYGNEKEDPLR